MGSGSLAVAASRTSRISGSIASLVGRTPLVQLRRFRPAGASLFLKLEQFNPGGSIKDRTALEMIVRAERDGVLRPGMRIVESSSGNTAIGLAMLAIERGYTVTAICDRHLPATKRAHLRAFGATIVFLPETPPGMDTVALRIAVASHLARVIPDCVSLGQYSNEANPHSHYTTTGPEIWDDLGGAVDAVVVAVGTCGTITGVGRFLKQQDSRIRIVGVEPHGSVIFGGADEPYLIQGGGLSFTPSILDRSVIDEGRKVHDADAIAAAHELARTEGWMVGGTGGLVAHVLGQLAGELGPGRNVIGIIPDSGDRYIDTLYEPAWLTAHELIDAADARALAPDAGTTLADAVREIGCSFNRTDEDAGLPAERIAQRLGVALPVFACAGARGEMCGR
jgi:cystathionine beta-synthase